MSVDFLCNLYVSSMDTAFSRELHGNAQGTGGGYRVAGLQEL